MRVLLILALALVVILLLAGRRRRAERWEPEEEVSLPAADVGQEPAPEPPQEPEPAPAAELPIPGAYRKRWLFSYREKDAYWAIREFCDRWEREVLTPWFAAQRTGAERPAKKKQKAGRIA